MVGLTAVGISIGTLCFFWWRSCRNIDQNIDSATEVNINNNNRVDVGAKIEIKQQMKVSLNCDSEPAPDIKSSEKPPLGSKEWYDWMIKRQDEILKDDEVRIKNQDKMLENQEKWMRKYCPDVLEDSSDNPDNSRD